MQRSKLPYFFFVLAALLAAAALVIVIQHWRELSAKSGVTNAPTPTQSTELPKIKPTEDRTTPQDPDAILKGIGNGTKAVDPAELVNRIAKAFETGDLAALVRLIGKEARDPETAERLKTLVASGLHLRKPDGVRQVGELELNVRARWAIELDGREAGHDRILLDLKRDGGMWSVEKITLPPASGDSAKVVMVDSLGVADAFLQAVLQQNFEVARTLVDRTTVSDTKIAGLCILFEEGEYRMRGNKPLRAMFQRDDAVGYLANVETADAKQNAQFSITMKQEAANAKWLVSEINLDQLIADYARRVAGGDVYYSPLVKNPAGGDTLALYFGFNEDSVNPRTQKQLEIVSMILKSDPGKKLTLSGHTDSLGTEDYNKSLSERRADVVRDFLIHAGVNATQIITVAKGSSQPRRPNVTETGQDNPEGRRANRRTEIYLDF